MEDPETSKVLEEYRPILKHKSVRPSANSPGYFWVVTEAPPKYIGGISIPTWGLVAFDHHGVPRHNLVQEGRSHPLQPEELARIFTEGEKASAALVIPDWLKEIAEGGRMIQSIKMAWVAIQSQPETKTLDDKPMTMDSGGELQIDQNEAYRTENVDDTFLSVEHALLSGSCEDALGEDDDRLPPSSLEESLDSREDPSEVDKADCNQNDQPLGEVLAGYESLRGDYLTISISERCCREEEHAGVKTRIQWEIRKKDETAGPAKVDVIFVLEKQVTTSTGSPSRTALRFMDATTFRGLFGNRPWTYPNWIREEIYLWDYPTRERICGILARTIHIKPAPQENEWVGSLADDVSLGAGTTALDGSLWHNNDARTSYNAIACPTSQEDGTMEMHFSPKDLSSSVGPVDQRPSQSSCEVFHNLGNVDPNNSGLDLSFMDWP